MSESAKAKLFMHGRSQAVRLPKDFRMPGTEVRVSRLGRGVLLEPTTKMTPEEIGAILNELDRLSAEPFMPEGRPQPPMPDMSDINFDDDLP